MRRMLERSHGEPSQATSIVRYDPDSEFDSHVHDHGEELLVLDGTFEDEYGEYPAGTFVKNPPGSQHRPRSRTGCTLFVKLGHLDPDDRERVVVHWPTAQWHQGVVPGLTVLPLWEFAGTNAALVQWAPHTRFNQHRHWGGEEIYVIDGVFEDEHGRYPAGTWLRSPHLSEHKPFSNEGCTIFVKTGHLHADLA
jgi:anti-sigma factor ChrR (cupin superfamily)